MSIGEKMPKSVFSVLASCEGELHESLSDRLKGQSFITFTFISTIAFETFSGDGFDSFIQQLKL